MPTVVRRAILPLLLVVLVSSALARQAQTQNPPPAQGAGASGVAAPVPTPFPAPAPRPPSPESQALTAAMALKDPDAKLAALEKIRTDFPQAALLASVDSQLLAHYVATWPDKTPEISAIVERIVARIPADAAPETRLSSIQLPVNQLLTKKLLLDRSEELIAKAVAALDKDKYAETMRANAQRANQPEPPAERIDSTFGSIKSRGLETLARIATAKGDATKAEQLYVQATAASAAYGPAVTALVDIYKGRKEYDKAEVLLKASIKAATSPAVASRPSIALADVYEICGEVAAEEALLKDTLAANPTLNTALVRMARIEAKRGDTAAALDHYIAAAVQPGMTAEDEKAMRDLYRSSKKGDDASLDAVLDKMYLDKFPNPVKPESYTPVEKRSDRMVLLEMFTGSGCGPCVSADLAFDAVLEHYPAGTIVPIAYHQNIPAPDPMVVSNGSTRFDYYTRRAVPTFDINGGFGRVGGGAREGAPNVYKDYITQIDKALQMPAKAALSVAASGNGDQIVVTTNVTKLPDDRKDLRLHIVLVERELRFQGENGIRFHPMVVRAVAGDKGTGIPITDTGVTTQTFSLTAIREDITNTLAAELDRRQKTEAAGTTHSAEGHAYTNIDPSALSVVAFIQQGPYRPPAGNAPAAGVEAAPAPAGAAAPAAPTTAAATPAATPAKADPESLMSVLQAAMAPVQFPGATAKKQ